ncbi:LysR family transcriptional regulator [Pleionea sp. CnH1-48]|uniref:LysR family transcriptional regulator n=1 Tax=Pleionea sp. CnH1-48 TaxID=2954494 RepID=UPI0020976103|nr:LysR family transcriptional regulator [Pleionea sp. CnH1-48]MCO7223126.1 LysR family transcriptional regulator [Pleionea sp. CnH1-48]
MMNSSHKDLNLLPALKVLLEEKHVSRAATRLNMTQSAMSRVLARLREQFEDALLVRVGGHYELTPKAMDMLPQLNQVLFEARQLWQPDVFEPETYEQRVTIAGTDMDVTLMTEGIKVIQKQAPGITFSIQASTLQVLDTLVSGEVDFAICIDDERAGLHRKQILSEDFVAVVDPSSGLTQSTFDLESFLSYPHGLLNFAEQMQTTVDRVLANMGKSRQIRLYVPTFAQMPAFLSGSSLIFTMPRTFAEYLQKTAAITILELPIEIPRFELYLYWHERQHKSASYRWIRQHLIQHSIG